MEPIFLEAVLQEKIWGGTKLQTEFGLELPSEKIGEAWSISAHPNGVSTVTSPTALAGIPLDKLYHERPEFFGGQQLPTFPLLVKILDAAEDLSIQVHPDDHYALEHEGELGKNECWYVIAAEEGAQIVYGHTAQTKEEFQQRIAQEEWDKLFTTVPVKAGDFFNVPSGTIHAIGKGIVILETQQNSDTTYRVYDYNRTDDHGVPRPLHIEQTVAVTTIPHSLPNYQLQITQLENATIHHYITNDYFSVWKWSINGEYTHKLSDHYYYLATVIDGKGYLRVQDKEYPLHKAQSFLLPATIQEVTLLGELTLILSRSEQ